MSADEAIDGPAARAPISAAAFATAMAAAGHPPDCAPIVACSGGPDSLALALLARDWAAARGLTATALCVDHGLRPNAATEAQGVAARLRDLGLAARVLHHDGPAPRRDIQAAARAIRFRLIACHLAAHAGGAPRPLLLGHHLDDQAETVLLRLARGSGVDGLSAMSPRSERDGLILIRPLLGFPKARLRATVEAAGALAVEDPSNRDRGFARVRMREASALLASEGLTPERLARTAARMARARDALDQARDTFLRERVGLSPAGFSELEPEALADLPEEIGLRVLAHLVRLLGGRDHPPREDRLIALHRWVCALGGGKVRAEGREGGGRTLAGTRILSRPGNILICREAAGLAAPVAIPVAGDPGDAESERAHGSTVVWDGRFMAALRFRDPDAVGRGPWRLGALGRDGIAPARAETPKALAALPGPVRPTLPSLWQGERLVAVPHLHLFLGPSRETAMDGHLAFRPVPDAWGAAFRRALPFSSVSAGPI